MIGGQVPVDQVVDVKVLVVLAEGVNQGLRNVEPAKVEDELEDAKQGDEHVVGCLLVVPGGNHVDIFSFLFKVTLSSAKVLKSASLPNQVDGMLRSPSHLQIKRECENDW